MLSVVAIPFPAFEAGFEFTPWENSARFSPPPAPLPTSPQPSPSSPAQAQFQIQQAADTSPRSSGSDEPDRNRDRGRGRGDERRLRRMISNRESARRSRMRKQRHLEDLRGQVDRLRSENRELADRLVAVTGHCLLFCRDNDRLRSEASALRSRLRVLIFRHLHRLAMAPSSPPPPLPSPQPPPPPPPVVLPPAPGGPQAFVTAPIYGGGFMAETELIA